MDTSELCCFVFLVSNDFFIGTTDAALFILINDVFFYILRVVIDCSVALHLPNRGDVEDINDRMAQRPKFNPRQGQKRPLDDSEHRPNKRPYGLDDFIDGVDQASGKRTKLGQVDIESDDDMEDILTKKRGPERSRPIFSVPADNGNDNEIERILAERRQNIDRKKSKPAFAVEVPQITEGDEQLDPQPIEIDPYEEPEKDAEMNIQTINLLSQKK